MSEQQPAVGRRERKKLETRDALRAAARTLFSEQGVAATSIEQITEAADVSQRTFFRYFESKYDLLLPDLTATFTDLEAALAERPSSEHPLVAYQIALTAVMAAQAAADGGMTTIAPGLDPGDPGVASRLARAFLNWEERLTEIFAERLATAPDTGEPLEPDQLALRAAATAGVAVAATRAVVRLVRRSPSLTPPRRLQLVTDTFEFVRTGCGASDTLGTETAV
ncbi:MAG TPA: TetR family transcriptional regulator [Jatrophihabitans sp.]|nr:TetR family transcriptional regulator [Jatrophihabitans sp.]